MSGYLRGFGISLIPALLTTLGVCGIRIALDPVGLSAEPNLPNDYDGLPHQPCCHGADDPASRCCTIVPAAAARISV